MSEIQATIHHGDCRDIIAELPDCSVDSIVTDPPYEIGFMGRGWDASGIAYDPTLWAQCLRVLKPGGHLLAFGGTRTYHRMAVAIEDAGFEIRDSIHWLYGSGFPKSLDVSKAIDKQRHDKADVYRVTAWIRATRDAAGITNRDIDAAFGANGMGRHWTDVPPHGKQPAVPTLDQVPTLLGVLGVTADDVPDDIRRLLWDLNGRKGQPGENWAKREVIGTKSSGIANKDEGPRHTIGASQTVEVDITAPATDAARQWEGWGTALKPAHEPILVARKPLSGTVAATVLEHGTGAINIDGCRIERLETDPESGWSLTGSSAGTNRAMSGDNYEREPKPDNPAGRWPANLILTHAANCADGCAPDCPVAELDRQSDTGGASRFFTVTEWDPTADAAPFRYVPKPSRAERNAGLADLPEQLGGSLEGGDDKRTGKPQLQRRQNHHPTVKPLALMRWLVRLVTPPGGTVLEPFAGSGTTMAAAILEDRHVIGCELTADYLPIIEGRITWAYQQRNQTPATLFDPTE